MRKNLIITMGVILTLGQPYIAAGADNEDVDMNAIMNANSKLSGSQVRMNKWIFVTDGVTDGGNVSGFMFAKETSNSDTLKISIKNSSGTTLLGTRPCSDAGWGTKWSLGNHPFGDTVIFEMKTIEHNSFRNDDTASDGFCHVMVMDFPGYNKTGKNIPSGMWLGWEDWMGVHDDYNDFCFILRGCNGLAVTNRPDGTIDRVPIKPRLINPAGNRILSWRQENKY